VAVDVAELLREANPNLDDHVIAGEEAEILRGHLPARGRRTGDLAAALLDRVETPGLADALDDHGVRADAVAACATRSVPPTGDPQLPRYQGCLVTGLRETYLRTRDVTLLHEEIGVADAALQATPPDDPELLMRFGCKPIGSSNLPSSAT